MIVEGFFESTIAHSHSSAPLALNHHHSHRRSPLVLALTNTATSWPISSVAQSFTTAIEPQSLYQGFHTITGTVTIDAPGTPLEALSQLKGAVDAHCPVLDMLTPKVKVNLDIIKRS